MRNDIRANRAHEGKSGRPHWYVRTTVYSEDLRPEEKKTYTEKIHSSRKHGKLLDPCFGSAEGVPENASHLFSNPGYWTRDYS